MRVVIRPYTLIRKYYNDIRFMQSIPIGLHRLCMGTAVYVLNCKCIDANKTIDRFTRRSGVVRCFLVKKNVHIQYTYTYYYYYCTRRCITSRLHIVRFFSIPTDLDRNTHDCVF